MLIVACYRISTISRLQPAHDVHKVAWLQRRYTFSIMVGFLGRIAVLRVQVVSPSVGSSDDKQRVMPLNLKRTAEQVERAYNLSL